MDPIYLLALFVLVAGGLMFFLQGRSISKTRRLPVQNSPVEPGRVKDQDRFFRWAAADYYINAALDTLAGVLFLLNGLWAPLKYFGLAAIVVSMVRMVTFNLRAKRFYR